MLATVKGLSVGARREDKRATKNSHKFCPASNYCAGIPGMAVGDWILAWKRSQAGRQWLAGQCGTAPFNGNCREIISLTCAWPARSTFAVCVPQSWCMPLISQPGSCLQYAAGRVAHSFRGPDAFDWCLYVTLDIRMNAQKRLSTIANVQTYPGFSSYSSREHRALIRGWVITGAMFRCRYGENNV
jgi:hypothetical protein